MTAHQIALLWHLSIGAYDRGEFGVEILSSLVRGLKEQARAAGMLQEVEQIIGSLANQA